LGDFFMTHATPLCRGRSVGAALQRTTLAALGLALLFAVAGSAAAGPPNILWITCEDMSPNLGCYGDAYSHSPAIDRLAAEGVRFTRCFTHIGVCAPSRSGIITGMYPPSIGSEHMRSTTTLADYVKCFPEYLRGAGYYCTNNAKTDYNFAVPKEAWDENSTKAHWKNRPQGKPFFAVFNLQVTHESQIRAPEKAYQSNTKRLTAEQRHDPAKAPLPPYFPDTPVVRRDVARYYDNITAMDYQVADALKELDEAGLADDTIVFFYSDHGAGLPRGKRWLYDSSTQVPLIVRYPKKLQTAATAPGTTRDDLVAFVDLAPTVLSLAGVEIPKHMQGQAFLGPQQAAEPRQYVYGCRDRMDERVDMSRSVRDKQFKYIRNYQWWKPYAQHLAYAEAMPTMQELRRLAAAGKLNDVQARFMATKKPREELYDCDADPHEVRNLASDPKFAAELTRLRAAHDEWTERIVDTGYLPESVLADIRQLVGHNWRDEPRLANTVRFLRKLQVDMEAEIDRGASGDEVSKQLEAELKNIGDDAGPFRVIAAFIRMADLMPEMKQGRELSAALQMIVENDKGFADPVYSNMRVAAASAVVRTNRGADGTVDKETVEAVRPALVEGMQSKSPEVRHAAILVVDELGPQAASFLDDVRRLLKEAGENPTKADKEYAPRIAEYLLKTRGGEPTPSQK
jgi:N-sulfoglucosamine sulfohydrolase